MARPLPANPETPRNGTHSSLARLAAELETEVPCEEDAPDPRQRWDIAPRPAVPDPLERENALLHEQLAEMERLLGELKQEAEQTIAEQQREYETILEQKAELIAELQQKCADSQQKPALRPGVNVPREEELMALSEELEQERKQLKDDEASMMQQMSQMEVQMSKERADLARQRNELVRLQAEIRHELELAARDAALHERLAPLQRRHQEMTRRAGGAPSADTPPSETPIEEGDEAPQKPTNSGLFRRLFGG